MTLSAVTSAANTVAWARPVRSMPPMTYNAVPGNRELKRVATAAAANARGTGSTRLRDCTVVSCWRVQPSIAPAPPAVACATYTPESGVINGGSAPPAAYSVVCQTPPAPGNSAAVSPMPAIAPGYAARAVHDSVAGLKNDRGRIWTVVTICVPVAGTTARASVPVAAESGT